MQIEIEKHEKPQPSQQLRFNSTTTQAMGHRKLQIHPAPINVMLLLTYLLLIFVPVLFLSIHTGASNLQLLQSLDDVPVLHLTISRRGGPFESFAPLQEIANLTHLAEELQKVEERFNLTRREVKGNKLVRKAKVKGIGGNEVGVLMGKVASVGNWYAKISIGEPPQEIEVDLDMLTSDFFVLTTTSRIGSKYDDFFSKTNQHSNNHPFPRCSLPTDTFHFPTLGTSSSLTFAHCRPSRSSSATLGASGSVLGLAPSLHLSQIDSPTLLGQLLDNNIIQRPIFSVMFINGQEGVLSIGGTLAKAVEMVVQRTKDELERLTSPDNTPETADNTLSKRSPHPLAAPMQGREPAWQEGWRWSKVQGAEGWWQILLQGVWVDGSKVLKNQPAVVDINTPFILAPPLAAKAFYASVSGSLQLPVPHDSFYIFPCLNPPLVDFEFDNWRFPAMQGGKGAEWFGMPGGRFSLGRYKEGSGYCVGAIVQTAMGVKHGGANEGEGKNMGGGGKLAGNGMRDVWVIGEGFFRGVGGVFDFKEQRVGFRTY
ncbi:hypothetical protein MMC18_008445 [Xylographa bjoerkii]|nr:hypothetical protein [Xylographa bjoerkii]